MSGFAPLTDVVTGRSSAWSATQRAAYVVLVDPNTGIPYVASGGGGGGGSALADVVLVDANGVLVLQRDNGTTRTFIRLDTGATYTPVGALTVPRAGNLSYGAGNTDAGTQRVTLSADGPTNVALGAPADAAATTDTGTFSILAFIKRGLQNWTTLLARVPAQNITGLLPVDVLGTPGTPRVQATSGTAASIVLTTTCRRVSMFATAGTWYSISGAATATSHYIGAGERLDFDVPASTTISVLQETAAGSIRITELT